MTTINVFFVRLFLNSEQVSGLDPYVPYDQMHESCREGLAQVFGVDADLAVTLGSPVALSRWVNNGDDRVSQDSSRSRRRRRLSSAPFSADTSPRANGPWRGKRRREKEAQQRWQPPRQDASSEHLEDEGHQEGSEGSRIDGRDLIFAGGIRVGGGDGGGGESAGKSSVGSSRASGNSFLRNDDAASHRELQTEGDQSDDEGDGGSEYETSSLSVSFKVLLPDEKGVGGISTSSQWMTPSSRVATVLDAHAQGLGRAVLADALGVSASNVR